MIVLKLNECLTSVWCFARASRSGKSWPQAAQCEEVFNICDLMCFFKTSWLENALWQMLHEFDSDDPFWIDLDKSNDDDPWVVLFSIIELGEPKVKWLKIIDKIENNFIVIWIPFKELGVKYWSTCG